LRLTVKPVGPELCSGRRVDQLCANAKLLADGPQTTLNDIADPKLAPDLTAIDRAALVSKSGLLGDYDEAAEVSQEVFLSAYRAIGQFRGDANFSTWLYRIALNHTSTRRKTLIRRQQRNVAIEDTEPVRDLQPGPAETMEKKEIRERVQRALNSLEPDDATVILLRDLQDIPYEEVARLLEIPVGTVKSRLHRARQALKSQLASYFYAGRKAV